MWIRETYKMFDKLHSGYVYVPLLGEVALECNATVRGRRYIDFSFHGLTAELFIGSTNIAWSRTRYTMPALTFVMGWCLTPPLSLLGIS